MNNFNYLCDLALLADTGGIPVSRRDVIRVFVPHDGATVGDIAHDVIVNIPRMKLSTIDGQLRKLEELGKVRLKDGLWFHLCSPTTRRKPRVRARRTLH